MALALQPRDLHEAFRATLMAFAYPGRPRGVPGASGDPRDVAVGLIAATFEASTPLWTDVRGLELPYVPHAVAPEAARLLVVAGDVTPEIFSLAWTGSDEFPEDAATLIAIGPFAARTATHLRGPGIDGSLAVNLPLAQAALRARALACRAFPRGVDALFVLGDGRIVGLPRTTLVEVDA